MNTETTVDPIDELLALRDKLQAMDIQDPRRLAVMGADLEGKLVVIRSGFADPLCLFRCNAGFGCSPSAIGRAVFGTWLSEPKAGDRIERGDVLAIVEISDPDVAALGVCWEKLGPKTRWIAQLVCQREQVSKAMKEHDARRGKRQTISEMLDVVAILRRQHARDCVLIDSALDYLATKYTD